MSETVKSDTPAPAPAPVDAAGLVARLKSVAEDCAERANATRRTLHFTAEQEAFRTAYVALRETASALAAAAEREAALEEKVRRSALDYLALDMQATEALEREAALVRERDALARGWDEDAASLQCAYFDEREARLAAEARFTAAEAERDAERERCAQIAWLQSKQGATHDQIAAAICKETT